MSRTALTLLILASMGCEGATPAPALKPQEVIAQASERARPADSLPWPDEPANGSPVAAVFQAIHKDDSQRRARLRLFNFSAQNVSQITMQLQCSDAEDTPVPCVGSGEKPEAWWTSSISLPGHGHGTHSVSSTLPPAVVHVSAEVQRVRFKDGKRWPPESEGP